MSRDRDNPDREPEDDLQGWLREHPERHGDLTDLQRLRELYRSAGTPQPAEAAWTATLIQLRAAVPTGRLARKHSPRPLWTALSLTAAAAAVAAILLMRSWETKTAPEEPFPVVEAGEVTILSMDARDVAALVVGEPPISGDLEFVQAADIHVIKCERCPKSGNVPRLAQGEVPMLITSVARGDDRED